nr:MAG TPA: hypothetical protein [Caudoviricetes sp.]DAH63380.1 MAG TPA: hypothetical protein [Caudoviricetes sp.]
MKTRCVYSFQLCFIFIVEPQIQSNVISSTTHLVLSDY